MFFVLDENNVFNVVGMCKLVEVIVNSCKEWVEIEISFEVLVNKVIMEVEKCKFEIELE